MKSPLVCLTVLILLGPGTWCSAAEPTRGERAQARAAQMTGAAWYELMDTGPFISDTYRALGRDGEVAALKGIAIKVGLRENHTAIFDTELLRMVMGFDGRVIPAGTPWDGNHGGNSYSPENRAACSTWNGDVWIASGLQGDLSEVTWKRYASGLFQTLGLKIMDGIIYTQGRDQITRLHDLNGNGTADYYENFNDDVKITDGFHEFSFDLLTDAEGNLLFSKGMPVLGYLQSLRRD